MIRKTKLEELNQYIDELKTVKMTESLTDNRKFLSINSSDCVLNNGKIIRREKLLKNGQNGSAVLILPITKENNTLLVIQPRVFTTSTIGIELPAGYIEKDENPETAALRELEEETGYIPKKIKRVISYYQDQGCSGAFNHSFIAFDCQKVKNQNLDKDEYIKYFECTYDEALELVDMEYINDAGSILLLEKSKVYMKGAKRNGI